MAERPHPPAVERARDLVAERQGGGVPAEKLAVTAKYLRDSSDSRWSATRLLSRLPPLCVRRWFRRLRSMVRSPMCAAGCGRRVSHFPCCPPAAATKGLALLRAPHAGPLYDGRKITRGAGGES